MVQDAAAECSGKLLGPSDMDFRYGIGWPCVPALGSGINSPPMLLLCGTGLRLSAIHIFSPAAVSC